VIDTVSPAELADRIATGTAPAILDVRSRWEFVRGHIKGSVHIPFWRISAHLHRIPATLEEPIVIYCGHGPRAMWAALALRRYRFRRLALLSGHWARWTRDGHPLTRT
jgi:rhodanese-related sulfurtransferase